MGSWMERLRGVRNDIDNTKRQKALDAQKKIVEKVSSERRDKDLQRQEATEIGRIDRLRQAKLSGIGAEEMLEDIRKQLWKKGRIRRTKSKERSTIDLVYEFERWESAVDGEWGSGSPAYKVLDELTVGIGLIDEEGEQEIVFVHSNSPKAIVSRGFELIGPLDHPELKGLLQDKLLEAAVRKLPEQIK